MLLLLCSLATAESRLVLTTDTPIGVWLDGRPIEFSPQSFTAIADDLAPGAHSLVLTTPTGKLLYAADLTIPDHAEARTRYRKGRFGVSETVPLPVAPAAFVDVTSRVAKSPGAWSAPPPAPPVAAPPPPPVSTAPVVVEFSSIDGEWANVRVDGVLVGELRNSGSRSASVKLTPGVHTVEVRDFMDNDVWGKGQLIVSGSDVIRVGIASEKAPEVYNRQDAWRPL